jgi:hypothetical protein
VGGTDCECSNAATSYRFVASTTGSLSSIRIYLVSGSGYSGGDGGTLQVSIESDDGKSDHAPSGHVLTSTSVRPGNPIAIGLLPLISFGSKPTLTSGHFYHVVFRNTDSSPRSNFVSVDGLWTAAVTNPRQPGRSDTNWAELLNRGSGWSVQRNITPILDLGYSNGVHQGIGYMEVWVRAPRTISGSSEVRENFSPSSARTISAFGVRLRRTSGSSSLLVRLETGTGAILGEATVSAGSIGSSWTWADASFGKRIALHAGQTYFFVVSTSSSGSYATFAIERGNNYQFSPATYFHDGYGQYTTGSGWSGFDQPGGSRNNRNADLQFFLR